VTAATSSNPTLHQRILSDVEGKIVSGEWPPGHRLPFEVELATHYNCSRMTVNKVMTQLAKSGLINRRKKSGSFVTRPQAQSAVLEITDIEAEVRSLNLSYSFATERRAIRKVTATDLQVFDVSAETELVDVVCIHFAGDRQFCVEERLISLATVPDAAEAKFDTMSPGHWLLGEVPWSTAEHRIRAVAASAEIAAMLDIPKGGPCLLIERRTWSGSGAVTYVRLTYAGDSHSLVARFSPAS